MSTRPAAVALLPAEPGVYRFRDDAGQVLYVGRAVHLRRRVGSYWGDLRDRPRLRRMMPQVARIEALVCDSGHEAAWAERNLLEHRKPRWNRVRGGLESPVWLRLDDSPVAPRLDFTFRPDPDDGRLYFGPYLGSTRARTAISALARCYPLAYTGSRLIGAQRDLAATRGVTALDRPALLATVTAVLARSGEAVPSALKELQVRRDAAAGELLFELAARIQDELEALTWVTSPQRATVPGGADADLIGWSDGMQFRLRVKAGRIYDWHQKATPAQAGHCGEWSPFLRRNAGLAAKLAAHPVG
ncbi:hypothetical protein GCM10022223_64090 [Kineosporia mesophila]|uniref:GIY-YIG domain-containing protein n=1 Tax=Kineosporia mesophila TaxID=566012 RepID=A0ABP7AP86_9ACTN|nr:GIY-YIG nuclease family protein [Kineosporia mesophila]MCD5349333.1 hypothetical protein [Kineosporia mesophila]